jgi:hypothetical protein
MMDFLLQNNDIKIVNGDLALCPTDKEATAQAIIMRLKTLAGEWFLDETLGIPYFQRIFGRKQSEQFIRNLLMNSIQTLSGVETISDFRAYLKDDRTMTINFRALLKDGSAININEDMGHG